MELAITDVVLLEGTPIQPVVARFGSFSVKIRGGRVGRNPRSGVTIHVPEKKVLAFRQSYGIRKRLNSLAPLAESSKHTGPSRRSSHINRRFK